MKKPNYMTKNSKNLGEKPLNVDEEKTQLNPINEDFGSSLINSYENEVLEGLIKHLDSIKEHLGKNDDYDKIVFSEMLEYLYPRLNTYKEKISSASLSNNNLINQIRLILDANFSFKINLNNVNKPKDDDESLNNLKLDLLKNLKLMIKNISEYIGIYINIFCKKKIKERVAFLSSDNSTFRNYIAELYNKNLTNSIKDPVFEELSILNIKNSINFLKSCSNENNFDFKSVELDYNNLLNLFSNKENEILLNLVLRQVCGITPIESLSRTVSSFSEPNTITLDVVNDDNQNDNENNVKNKTHYSDLFYMSIYFGVAFKLIHSTNVYVIQPNLNLYLESIGYSEYDSGYILAIMHIAKLLSCFWYSYWTNYSYKLPYYFAVVLMILANVLYATSYFFEAHRFTFITIIISRILIGLGSAKIIHKRMSIEFSTYFNLFYFAIVLMIVNNLGHSLGPLINLLMSFLLSPDNKYNFVFPSIVFIFIWIGVTIYLKYFFKDPYEIKKQIEENLEAKKLHKIYVDEKIKEENQIVAAHYEQNLRPTIISSLKMHHFVLIAIFTIFRGVLEFQLWIIPILMGNIFGISTIGYTYYTITITLLCKNICIYL